MAGSMRWRTRSPPSCHQPCVRPVSSRSLAGSLKKIWQETANTSRVAEAFEQAAPGNPAPPAYRCSAGRRCRCVAARNAGVGAAAEAQVARQRQHLDLRKRAGRRTPRCHRSEPLSTTMISLSGLPARRRSPRADTSASRSLPFQLGITTERRAALAARPREDRCRRQRSASRRHRLHRSVSARARSRQRQRQRAETISNGESSSSGRQRRSKRFSKAMSSGVGAPGRARPCGPASPSGKPRRAPPVRPACSGFLLRSRSAQAVRSSQLLLGVVQRFHRASPVRRSASDFHGERGFHVPRPLASWRAGPASSSAILAS